MLAATDNNEPATTADDTSCSWRYDSLSRVVEESQKAGAAGTTAVVSHAFAGLGESVLTYPNGRMIAFDYLLPGGPLRSVSDADGQGDPAGRPIAKYDYLGGRTLVRAMRNGVHLDLRDAANGTTYDAAGQPTKWQHLANPVHPVNPVLIGFDTAYDAAGNKQSQRAEHDPAESQRYAYDSADRLTAFVRGQFDVTPEAFCAPSTGTWPALDAFQSWTLDGSGNWSQFTARNAQATSATVETRSDDTFNAYTSIVVRASGLPPQSFAQSHDLRGNLLSDGKRVLKWDAFNRLREVHTTTGVLVVVYTYDATSRRAREVVAGQTGLDFAYAAWDVLEEDRASDGATLRQYVEGPSVDEHLELTNYVDAEGAPQSTIQGRYYYHQDALGSVVALTDASGAVVESYVYDPYGKHAVRSGLTGSLVVGGASSVGNFYMYTSRRFDHATGYLYYRYRLYDPEQGRFINQDPIGLEGGLNLYAYVGGNPLYYTDPLGQNWLSDAFTYVLIGGDTAVGMVNEARGPGSYSSNGMGDIAIGVEQHGANQHQANNMVALANATGGVVNAAGETYVAALVGAAASPAMEAALAAPVIGTGLGGGLAANGAINAAADLTNAKVCYDNGDNLGLSRNLGKAAADLLQAYLGGSGGRWGGSATRALNDELATQLEGQGLKVTRGAGRGPEEYIAGSGPGTVGGTFVDITASNGGVRIRIQTVSTLANGMPTGSELAAAIRIATAFPDDLLILFPKWWQLR